MSYNNYQRNGQSSIPKVTVEAPISARPLPPQRDVPEYLTPSARQLRAIHPSSASRLHDNKGHTRSVKSMSWSCNGQMLATAGDDRNVRLWDYKRPGEASGPSYRTAADPFSQPTPDPLLPAPSNPSSSSASNKSTTPSPTTTCDSPIILLAFSPRDPDILAVASAGLQGGENDIMTPIHPGDKDEEKDLEKERKEWAQGGKEKAGDGKKRLDERKVRMDGPKVTIWNIRKRQILLIVPLPISTPVSLTFHPSSLQLAVVFMQSALQQDTAWFIFRPASVSDPASDLLLEDPAGGRAEQVKREKEKVWMRELGNDNNAIRQQASTSPETEVTSSTPSNPKDDRWQLRRDILLGEKVYKVDSGEKVPEFNGAMFSPCGTRFYAGNHDGALYAWAYPIRPVVVSEEKAGDDGVKDVNGGDADGLRSKKSEKVANTDEMQVDPNENPSQNDKTGAPAPEDDDEEGQEDDDDSVSRRRRKVQVAEDEAEDEPTGAEEDAAGSTPVGGIVADENGDEPSAVKESEEGEADAESGAVEEKADTGGDGDVEMKDGEEEVDEESAPAMKATTEGPAAGTEDIKAEESVAPGAEADIEMKDADMNGDDTTPNQKETEPRPEPTIAEANIEPPTGPKNPEKPDSPKPATDAMATATATQTTPDSNGPSAIAETSSETAKKSPREVGKQLQFLFRQTMHVGCMNCIDIDPKRRYIATGGSEGLVNLSDHREWISVKAFDSYTEEIKHLKFSWDGEYLAAAGQDRCIDIMATATGTTVHRIQTRTNVQCLAWSPARHILCFALENHASGAAGQAGDWFYVTL